MQRFMPGLVPTFLVLVASGVVTERVGAQDVPQATLRARVESDGAPVLAAVVHSGAIGARTDSSGMAVLSLPAGDRVIVTRRIGFAPDTLRLTLRPAQDTTVTVALREQVETIAPVVVTSTRAERRIEDEPLRVEVLAGEDVAEKTQMHPADLRTLLTEMSGVRVQTTSPALGAAAVRVQGLQGRYTLTLVDGLPLFGARSSGFGLAQLPPLDLRQAEVIKGAASALYGPQALGGVVNLVSRRPADTSQVLASQSARGGTDLLGFLARPLSSSLGITLLGGAHRQRATDVGGDGWADIPGFQRAELRPRLFYDDSAGRSLMVTAGTFAEDRGGGMIAGAPSTVAFAESLATRHGDAGLVGRMRMTDAFSLAIRASASLESRDRLFGDARERDRRGTLFGELTGTAVSPRSVLVGGLAWQHESYHNRDLPRFDESATTPGVFLQETVTPAQWLSGTLNGRCDLSSAYGTVCSPRASLLFRPLPAISARASVGGGWFAPSTLTEETEATGLSRVAAPRGLAAERARTASFDLTATHGPLQVNGTLFANRVRSPVGLRRVPGDTTGLVELVNASGPMRTWGGELFAVYSREPVIATVYYAATRSRETSPETGRLREVPLTPRQEAGLDLAFEEDESGTYLAGEVFYTGRQSLEDDPYAKLSRPYATLGILASRRIGRATIFVNLENLTGVRQTRFEPLPLPRPGAGGRRTVDAWAPLEGRLVSAGLRLSL
ncbi:MAG TPA: TonB-dependent receptor [Gemmatimonadaceae bacterium]